MCVAQWSLYMDFSRSEVGDTCVMLGKTALWAFIAQVLGRQSFEPFSQKTESQAVFQET